MDAIALPFVQGQLRNEHLSFVIDTECGHCLEPFHIEIDSGLGFRVREQEAEPLIYVPPLDLDTLEDPSIIDAF
jgi:hypothetical protein